MQPVVEIVDDGDTVLDFEPTPLLAVNPSLEIVWKADDVIMLEEDIEYVCDALSELVQIAVIVDREDKVAVAVEQVESVLVCVFDVEPLWVAYPLTLALPV